jgi:hypothetical protein
MGIQNGGVMNSNKKTAKSTPRLLGAAFLMVIVTSLLSDTLLKLSGSISDILMNISDNLTLMRISILFGLVTSIEIVVLAVLLYIVLNKQNKIIALVALGWWLAEAIFLALRQIGAFALIPLSLDFIKAGVPVHSFYQTLGEFLYYGVYKQAYTIHFLFYCIGGILWYYLFYKSKYIPRVISLFGLIAVSVALVGIVFEFFGYDVSIFVYLPILPFELTIGVWLMLRGIKDGSET